MYRVKHAISLVCSLNESETLIGFERTNSVITQTIRSDPEVGLAETVVIGPNTVKQALNFGGVGPAQVVYLEASGPLTVFLNGILTGIPLAATAGIKAKFFWEGTITGIEVTNASTTEDVLVSYMVAGVAS